MDEDLLERLAQADQSSADKLFTDFLRAQEGKVEGRIKADAPSEDDHDYFNNEANIPEFTDAVLANSSAGWHDYEYSSLRSATRYIRLLRLLPGDQEPIQCTLKTRDIRCANNGYVAVSYVWGSPSRVKKIKVDGLDFRVPYNCWTALWQMRNGVLDQHQHFWIDFICIDQNNVQERNQQVQIMGEIFANAAFVAACIGTSTRKQDFENLSSLGPRNAQEDHSDLKRRRLSTGLLSKRPYFGRLWIVQECWLARSVRVYCGSNSILAEGLINCCFGSGRDSVTSTLLREANTVAPAPEGCLTLSRLVIKFAARGCADPRDKIYALLSLASPLERRSIPVDYRRVLFGLMCDHVKVLCDQATQRNQSTSGDEVLVEAIRSLQTLQRCYALDSHFCAMEESFLSKRMSHVGWRIDDSALQSTLQDKYLNIQVKSSWELHTNDFYPTQSNDTDDLHRRTVILADFPSWTNLKEVVEYVSKIEEPRDAKLEQFQHYPWRGFASFVFFDESTAMRVCKALDHAKYKDRRLSAFIGTCSKKIVRLRCKVCEESTTWHVPHTISYGDILLQVLGSTALVFRYLTIPVPHHGLIALAKRETQQPSRCRCEQEHDWRLALHEEDLLAMALTTRYVQEQPRLPPAYFVDSKSYLIEDLDSDPIWFGSYQ